MLIEPLSLLISLSLAVAPAIQLPFKLAAPTFRPVERAVTNWRMQSLSNLDIPAPRIAAFVPTADSKSLPRCVRLNNYWCIKKAGWAGEIASDAEGHVAFASARKGAEVAALLLRRYYVDYGLKSARAIVSRWAPAQCGMMVASSGGRSVALGGLTTRGIGTTLRARWLASHGRAGTGHVARSATKNKTKIAGLRQSVVRTNVSSLIKTPSIAVGMGEVSQPLTRDPVRLALLPFPGMAMGGDPRKTQSRASVPISSCASETNRIANYAARASDGVAGSDADLLLFDASGKPLPALARVLVNMASVEIGPLAVQSALVDAAIDAAAKASEAARLAKNAASAKPAP